MGSSFNQPEPQMVQYHSHDLLIFNENDNAHFPLASGASKGICLINIIYLLTNAADKISGLVFSLGGNGIGLYSEPEIAKNLVKIGDPWTMEGLIHQVPRALFEG